MSEPSVKPTVATPRAQLKRKHGEIVDLTEEDVKPDHITTVHGVAPGECHVQQRRLEDDDFDDEDGSMYEEMLDQFELNPYVPGEDDDQTLSAEVIAGLRRQLLQIGPGEFILKYLTKRAIPRRLLGTAFGIPPDLDVASKDMFMRLLGIAIMRAYHKRQKLPQHNTMDDAADLLRKCHKIMVITGAGISTSLGIPDFRSKDTGFYEKIKSLGYTEGEEVFNIHSFDHDPSVFYSLAGDILPDQDRFSPTHAFLRLLQDKKRLQTNYTQNIDNLEELAGIDKERLIQCHGSFATASCRKCHHQVPGQDIFGDIRAKRISRCKRCLRNIAKQPPKKKQKPFKLRKNDWDDSSDDEGAYDIPEAGVMKPDITFFGEQLPDNFFERFTDHDSKNVDLVIVIGTSLKVAPVSEMPNHLPHDVPHIFISREPIRHVEFDIQLLGDCDHVVYELCRRAGWSLRHEMIPPHFRVKVRPVEGSNCMWTVKPRKSKSGAPAPRGLGTVDTTPRHQESRKEVTLQQRQRNVGAAPKVKAEPENGNTKEHTASQTGNGTAFTALYRPH